MHADLVIVGGGLVGASLAAAMCANPLTKPLSVVLIDPSPPSPPSPSPSSWPPLSSPPRTSTLTPSTQAFLSDIGAWQLIPTSRIAPVDSMLVWDTPHLQHSFSPTVASTAGIMHFNASEINEELLAYVIDNDTIRTALYHALHTHINSTSSCQITVLPTSVSSIDFRTEPTTDSTPEDQWPRIKLADGSFVHARLVAACDGPRSRIRTLLDADWLAYDYREAAVVANVRVADASCAAYQRFLSTGPIALLPLAFDDAGSSASGAPLANIVWSTTQAEARALVAADDAEFLDELNIALSSQDDGDDETTTTDASVVDNIMTASEKPTYSKRHIPNPPVCTALVGNRASFPLHAGHAPRYVIPEARTVLVGDAAHAVHPLAGQGVNLGFADARALTDCIASAAAAGRDFGGEHGAPLHRYELTRMPSNLTAIAGLHALRGMFALRRPFRDVRRLGMSIVDGAGPIKQAILRLMR